jgi:hypothetical protein
MSGGDDFEILLQSPVVGDCAVCNLCMVGEFRLFNNKDCPSKRDEVVEQNCTKCPEIQAKLLDLSNQLECAGLKKLNYSVDCLPGSYLSLAILTISGDYAAVVRLNKTQLIQGVPFTVNVFAREPYALQSSLISKQSYIATAGHQHIFLVTSADIYGNLANSAVLGVLFGLDAFISSGRESVGTSSSDLSATENGVFKIMFTFTLSGPYLIHITARPYDQHIKGSPFQFYVRPGEFNASSSFLIGKAISLTTAGYVQHFNIFSRDKFCNVKLGKNDNLTELFRTSITSEAETKSPSLLCNVSAAEDGTYRTSYQATISGQYSINTLFDGILLKGCPYLLRVEPGKSSPNHIHVGGKGVSTGKVNTTGLFQIRSADFYGNSRSIGGDIYIVNLYGGWTRSRDNLQRPKLTSTCFLIDCMNGSYIVEYLVTRSGNFQIFVSLIQETAEIPIVGSPFSSLQVEPGQMAGTETVLYGFSEEMDANDNNVLFILGKDLFGNPLNVTADLVQEFNASLVFNSTTSSPSILFGQAYDLQVSFSGESNLYSATRPCVSDSLF